MTFRDQLSKYMQNNPQAGIRALKSAGIRLTDQEEADLSQGKLDQFSDAELRERFNTKVMGMLGISATDATQGTSGSQGSSGASSAPKE